MKDWLLDPVTVYEKYWMSVYQRYIFIKNEFGFNGDYDMVRKFYIYNGIKFLKPERTYAKSLEAHLSEEDDRKLYARQLTTLKK